MTMIAVRNGLGLTRQNPQNIVASLGLTVVPVLLRLASQIRHAIEVH
jgi:hypothetical protein